MPVIVKNITEKLKTKSKERLSIRRGQKAESNLSQVEKQVII